MFQKALSYLVGLGADNAKNHVHEIEGVSFVPDNFDLSPVKMPGPDILKLTTLTGLVDYVKANRDKLDLSEMVVAVHSPAKVALCGRLSETTLQRFDYVVCEPLLPQITLEAYLNSESFNMQLQYGFVPSKDRATLLALTACVLDTTQVGVEDNGVNQTVTVKKGINRGDDVATPNPITLRPYRTFAEIEQPESTFILRMKSDPLSMGLWAADGGAWRLKAMADIKAFLAEKMPEIAVLA